MPALLSALVALACALAAGLRLVRATAPTGLDPTALLEALQQSPRWQGLGARARVHLEHDRNLQWERDLLLALEEPREESRRALAEEQWLELRWRVQRGERVPRVCASIATNAGFLLAATVLLRPVPFDAAELFAALTPFGLGLAGMSFCVAVHLRARRIVPERLAAYDRLVEAICDAAPLAGSTR